MDFDNFDKHFDRVAEQQSKVFRMLPALLGGLLIFAALALGAILYTAWKIWG